MAVSVLKFQPLKAGITGRSEYSFSPIRRDELAGMPAGRLLFLEPATESHSRLMASGTGLRSDASTLSCRSVRRMVKKLRGQTRAAENGATAYQLMAMYGWASVKQAEVYTRKAQRKARCNRNAFPNKSNRNPG